MPRSSATTIRRNILYYPTINVPTNDWLRNAVLYWDEVSSIVPSDWRTDRTIEVSRDLRLLMDEGIFRPIAPDQLLLNPSSRQEVQNLTDEFISIVQSKLFKAHLKRRRTGFSRLHETKIPKKVLAATGHRLHIAKATYMISEFLTQENLAVRDKNHWQWLQVESSTALLYMSLLAKYIALTDRSHTIVGTDKRIYERFNFRQSASNKGMSVINCNFHGLIPSPLPGIRMSEIIKFKKKRADNLTSFRQFLLDIQSQLAKVESNQEVKDILATSQENLKKGLKDLKLVFKDSGIDILVKSFKSIVNVQSSTTVVGGALLINESFKVTGLPAWIKASALALTGIIDITSGVIETQRERRRFERDSPFSYLFHAQRARIVQPLLSR